jgi:hypothetical protein
MTALLRPAFANDLVSRWAADQATIQPQPGQLAWLSPSSYRSSKLQLRLQSCQR